MAERSQPYINGTRFINPWSSWRYKSYWEIMTWFWQMRLPPAPTQAELDRELPIHSPSFPNEPCIDEVRATWLGQASVLFQLDGTRVLCDPLFSERCSPSQYFGPKRHRRAPCQVADLPHVDAVMISHSHYDHLDYGSVLALHARFPELQWFVPRGCKSWMQACGPQHVQELTWWEEAPLGDRKDFRVVFTPTQHWSGRGMFDTDKILWGSWVIRGPTSSVWFAGDTGYCEVFPQIGAKYGPFDLAAIPIGAYEPRWFMCHQHINPEEAVQIHKDVNAKASLAIHWGTFIMTSEPFLEPRQKLKEALESADVSFSEFLAPNPGETLVRRLEDGKIWLE